MSTRARRDDIEKAYAVQSRAAIEVCRSIGFEYGGHQSFFIGRCAGDCYWSWFGLCGALYLALISVTSISIRKPSNILTYGFVRRQTLAFKGYLVSGCESIIFACTRTF